MTELKVKNVIMGKQFENSENFQKLLNIAQKKNIKVKTVEAGEIINIEKNIFLEILWPSSKEVINTNILNNNSLVCKLVYKEFSMIFTGDIEKEAEEVICKKYTNTNKLKATILKVAHHGSKSSSTDNLLNLIKPKIALIGVRRKQYFWTSK